MGAVIGPKGGTFPKTLNKAKGDLVQVKSTGGFFRSLWGGSVGLNVSKNSINVNWGAQPRKPPSPSLTERPPPALVPAQAPLESGTPAPWPSPPTAPTPSPCAPELPCYGLSYIDLGEDQVLAKVSTVVSRAACNPLHGEPLARFSRGSLLCRRARGSCCDYAISRGLLPNLGVLSPR